MHHYVCDCAVGEFLGVEERVVVRCCGVFDFSPKENARVAVHGGLRGNGSVEFPHYDRFGVIEEILAHSRKVVQYRDGEIFKLLCGTNAR